MCNNITQQNLIMQKNQKQNGEKLKKIISAGESILIPPSRYREPVYGKA